MQRTHGGIERGEELVGHQHLAPREGAHQGGLAGIGVAHQRYARQALARLAALVRLPPRALCLPLHVHRGNLDFQLGDAVADFLFIQRKLRLAGATAAGAAALPALRARQFRSLTQSRCHVTEPRDLHLRARRTRAGVTVEYLQDDHGAVHHLAADFDFEITRLRRRYLVVDENDVGAAGIGVSLRLRSGPGLRRASACCLAFRRTGCCVLPGVRRRMIRRIIFAMSVVAFVADFFTLHELANLMPLAGTQVRRRIEPGAVLDESGDDLIAQCFCQFAQLGQRRFKLGVGDGGQVNGGQDGA